MRLRDLETPEEMFMDFAFTLGDRWIWIGYYEAYGGLPRFSNYPMPANKDRDIIFELCSLRDERSEYR